MTAADHGAGFRPYLVGLRGSRKPKRNTRDDPIDMRHKDIVGSRVWGDGEPEGVRQRAAEEMKMTARTARRLGVDTVIGFTGSAVWKYVAMFPPGTDRPDDSVSGRARRPGLAGGGDRLAHRAHVEHHLPQRETPVRTSAAGVSGTGSAPARKSLRRQRQPDITSPSGWGCVAFFVDNVCRAASIQMPCAATNPGPEDRDSVERVTGIEPAWPAWKA